MIEKKILKGYISKGLSIVPLKKDKRPNVSSWKQYQSTFINVEENAHLFEGIGLVCGEVSGGVEVVDVDQKNEIYNEEEGHLIDQLKAKINLFAPGLYDKLTVAETVNGGYHLIYKCKKIAGNLKLASREPIEGENTGKVVLLETRGEAGYIVACPTEGYKIINGKMSEIPIITPEERDTILSCCRMFDEVMPPVFQDNPKNVTWNSEGITPWQDYNERGNWQNVLSAAGWTIKPQKGVRIPVCRPDRKTPSGNFNTQYNLLRVFSSSTIFDTDKSYNPFSIYAMIQCNGDVKMAARELSEAGYGRIIESKFKKADEPADIDDSHEYLSDVSEEENIFKFAKGELEIGRSTGYPSLDEYYRFKPDQFDIIGGIYNVGKSTMIWLFKLIDNVLHGKKTAFFCPENRMWAVKMAMIELLVGEKIQRIPEAHIKLALKYLNSQFKYVEIEDDVSYKDILNVADKILQKEKFDSFVIDPYNSIMKLCFEEIDRKNSIHDYHYAVADKFKKWVMSRGVGLTVNMHPTSEANRRVHQSGEMKGYQMPCRGVDLEGGGKWGNKVDDLAIIHRYYKHSDLRIVTEIHVDKIKNQWSGGKQTPDDEPVKLIYKRHRNFLGFWDEDVNPLENWFKKTILGEEIVQTKEPSIEDYSKDVYEEDTSAQEENDFYRGNTFRNVRPQIEEEEESDVPY